ncbi:TetR/AcrR family transcriptional regulator [Aeromicrobium piscarium]|uniref:TetR/AcrR family transcriptional regulator n=1 Tax=Aeromicrobium piscarium TaxID=2590901 RepID=UPI00163D8357|nr:TetR/AcrR family transcriptional regulator [Aeromicrobium piscarium]
MSDVRPRRTYSSPRREAEAAATRRRIVEAAHRLFVRDGYGLTTVRDIAVEAGVSVPTVRINGPKPALLLAAYEMALAGVEDFISLNDTAAMGTILATRDRASLIEAYAGFMAAALERMAELTLRIRSAADADAEVRELYLRIDERRVRSIHEGVALLASTGMVPVEEVEHVETMVGLLVSADTYLHLRAAGWDDGRYRSWLIDELTALVAG